MPTIQIERRRKGVFGWFFTILFWAWNALMVWWFVSAIGLFADSTMNASSDAERVGTAIGATIGSGVILGIWVCGAAILGMMMFFSRGTKVIETRET